jgi:hypothetical protein
VAWSAPGATVRIRLFELLTCRGYQVRNLGPDPILCAGGYLGPGASRELRPGDAAGPGLLEVSNAETGAVRRLEGEVQCQSRDGAPRLLARVTPREYVAGVIAAELPGHPSALRIQLGAAVLRFLAQGPRYPDAEVGDSTRSAYFIGRGPRLDWSAGQPARVVEAPAPDPGITDADWAAMTEAARAPGPSQWSSSSGGRAMSAHEVWGGGTADAPVPATAAGPVRPWTRTWSAAQVRQAFGVPVQGLEVAREDGVWVLRVSSGQGCRSFRYDQVHRLLAKVLGWGALPSPADRVEPVAGGFRATGAGLGHRVGLSLEP